MTDSVLRPPAAPTPSRYWLKLDALLHRNPKVGRLTDAQFRAYVTSLCEAKLCQSEGEWPSRDHYAFAVGPKVARHAETLIAAGLLDVDDDGWVHVHDWTDWQPKDPTSADRSRRYRDKKRGERDATRDATNGHVEEKDSLEVSKGLNHAGVAASGMNAAAPPRVPRWTIEEVSAAVERLTTRVKTYTNTDIVTDDFLNDLTVFIDEKGPDKASHYLSRASQAGYFASEPERLLSKARELAA